MQDSCRDRRPGAATDNVGHVIYRHVIVEAGAETDG